MMMKSRLRVTQRHWKQNHWTDHTRLTISRVIIFTVNIIVTLLEMLVRGHSKTLKMVPFESLDAVFYSHSSNYGRIFKHFGDIQRQRMA